MKRWLLYLAVLLLPLTVLGQQATQSVPNGLVDPVAMVAYNSSGQFKFLSIDQLGNLIAGGSGVGQTASGPFGFVAPVAPVAIDPNGNWQFLHVDVNGNLQTSGVSGGGGSGGGSGGTSTFIGGTLTQPLYLASNPTTALQAATKSYVDTALAAVTLPSSPTFQTISASSAVLSGALTAATGTFSGAVSVGSLTAGTGTFGGLLSAPSANIAGAMSVGGTGTFNALAASTLSVSSISYAGSGAFIFGGNPVTSDPTGSSFSYPVAYWNSAQVFSTMDTSKNIRRLGDAVTVNGAAVPVSASCMGSNSLGQLISASCSGSGGSMIYPGAGIPVSVSGTSWGTSLTPPTSALVGISDTQTLTNKSIAVSEITGLPTFPTGNIVGTSDAQTLTNKSIAFSQITGIVFPSSNIVGISDTQTLTNKSIASTEITGLPTFPSGTILGTTDTQTLTNKSINASEINSGNLNFSVFPVLSSNSIIGASSGTTASVLSMPNCGTSGTQALTWTQNTGFSCVAVVASTSTTDVVTSMQIIEEFLGGAGTSSGNIGENGWLTRTIGTTGAAFVQATDATSYIGQEKITTPATAANGSHMYLGSSGTMNLSALTYWHSSWFVKLGSVTSGEYRVGFTNAYSGTAIPTTGVYFRYAPDLGDTFWMACVSNSGTETCTKDGVSGSTVAANNFYYLQIYNTGQANIIVFDDGQDAGQGGGVGQTSFILCGTGSCNSQWMAATVPTAYVTAGTTVVASAATAVSAYYDRFEWDISTPAR